LLVLVALGRYLLTVLLIRNNAQLVEALAGVR
jgi:hypothetical protein